MGSTTTGALSELSTAWDLQGFERAVRKAFVAAFGSQLVNIPRNAMVAQTDSVPFHIHFIAT
jgi:hypothetical protein